MKIIRTVFNFALALGFATALTACGSNDCDKLADEVQSCYDSSECQDDMTCKAAADAAANAMGGESVECTGAIEALATSCLGTVQASNQCACQLSGM